MAKKQNQQLVVALDMGTSKIAVLVGEVNAEGGLDVIGLGSHPSHGLKRGVVVNIEATVQSIQRALEEAELMAGCEIHSAFTGIAGSHIKSLNSHGIVAIRDREVNKGDVDRVIDAAKAVAIPADQQILHILPQEFIIDYQPGVREPIGMSGVRLEAKVHIVTGSVSAVQNISKCVRRCGLQIGDIVLEQLASSHAVLTDDEKELGVCVIDIGAGTTDIAVFTEGAIRYTSMIPIAGDHVTNDLAVALRTSTAQAERLKIEHGSVQEQEITSDSMIDVQGVGPRAARQVQKRQLAEVISARYEEVLQIALTELRRAGFEDLISAGVVLTGGASQVHGLVGLAEKVFKLPARLGVPHGLGGLNEVRKNPSYATGVGLLLHGYAQQGNAMPARRFSGSAQGIWARMRDWVQGNF